MLKIRFKENKYNAVWLVEPKITIGRSATNALVIDDPLASDVHLEVVVDNEHLTLRNLVPSQAVMVNGQNITGACELKVDDSIAIGSVELVVIDPKREARPTAAQPALASTAAKPTGWSLKANHAALANRVFPLKDITTIGRSNECDISLPAAHLSRRHAQLHIVDGILFVKDLGSANGTFLNGKRVTEARVKRGDELRFDALSFGVMGPVDDMAKTTVRTPASMTVPDQHQEARGRKPSPVARPQAQVAKTSSVNRTAGAKPSRSPIEAGHKGWLGLLFLGLLAVMVITTLVLTRK